MCDAANVLAQSGPIKSHEKVSSRNELRLMKKTELNHEKTNLFGHRHGGIHPDEPRQCNIEI